MTYVVVSGIPASGKSTLARQLAPLLSLPVLDKDDILDGLFESFGIGDAEWRSKLSRAADDMFCRLAPSLGAALLVSWWRHPSTTGQSGTPTSWLSALPGELVEIHCVCPPRLAATRFLARQRHSGHRDGTRSLDELSEQFEQFALPGPLGYGPVLRVATATDVDTGDVLAFVRANRRS